MGSNFGDIDNDGFLDFYLGTGRPAYSYLMPNVLLHNVGGRRFEDVTVASGTGHLQKGHGISFADWDRDGDVDLFLESGGATPGDRAHNVLFQNPGHGHHWLTLKLVGTRSNRAAIGARVRIDVSGPEGPRSIHRVIGGGSSFGNNPLTPTIGLGKAEAVAAVEVTWPTGAARAQSFRSVPGRPRDRDHRGPRRVPHLTRAPWPRLREDGAGVVPVELQARHLCLQRPRVTVQAGIDQDQPRRRFHHIRGRWGQPAEEMDARDDGEGFPARRGTRPGEKRTSATAK